MGRSKTLKEVGNQRYIINEDFSINAWWKTDEEGTPPWLYQPHRLDGTPWASAEEAEQWFISEYTPQDITENGAEDTVE